MNLRKVAGCVVCLSALVVATDLIWAQNAVPKPDSPPLPTSDIVNGVNRGSGGTPAPKQKDLLYVAVPGVNVAFAGDNKVARGGSGILVYDIAQNYSFIKRIPTWEYTSIQGPQAISGLSASAETGLLYLQSGKGLTAIDLVTEKVAWEKTYGTGRCCDRGVLSPDGKMIYAGGGGPAHGVVVDAKTGDLIKIIEHPKTVQSHNTIWSFDGSRVIMSGEATAYVSVADPKTHTVVQVVGPFSYQLRGITTNGNASLVFATMVDTHGFEIGDVRTGKVLHRVEVPSGFGWKGRDYGHGTPSHNIAMSPDEKEIWLGDGANLAIHIFDATVMPPTYKRSITGLRSEPGWITFDMDGKRVYPSSGDIIDAATKRIIGGLFDEYGRKVESEKLVDVRWDNVKKVPIRVGNSYSLGHGTSPMTSSANR